MDLYILYMINAALSTVGAITYRDVGWINCAIQMWLVTLLLFLNKEKLR